MRRDGRTNGRPSGEHGGIAPTISTSPSCINITLTPSFLRETCPKKLSRILRIELSPFRELRIFRGRRCFRLEFWEGEGSAAIVSRDDLFEAGVAQLPFETRRDLMVRAASRRLDEPDTKRSSNRLM